MLVPARFRWWADYRSISLKPVWRLLTPDRQKVLRRQRRYGRADRRRCPAISFFQLKMRSVFPVAGEILFPDKARLYWRILPFINTQKMVFVAGYGADINLRREIGLGIHLGIHIQWRILRKTQIIFWKVL